jgi:Arc/MetJ family transcription regulator
MRTNIEIDDKLMQQAMAATGATTKKDAVDAALRLTVQLKLQGEAIENLRGIATWVGHDDDWFAPDPLDPEWNAELAKRTQLEQPASGLASGTDLPAALESTSAHGHR